MVSQENLDRQHNSKEYRIIMGGISFVFLILVRYALTKVAVRIQYAKDNMWVWLKPLLFRGCILLIVFFIIVFLISRRGKSKQREQTRTEEKKINNTDS